MKNGDRSAIPYTRPPTSTELQAAEGASLTEVIESGVTKRELFAAMAMQGLIAGNSRMKLTAKNVADSSVFFADALLQALEES